MGGILRGGVNGKCSKIGSSSPILEELFFSKRRQLVKEAILRRLGSSPKRSGQYTKTHSALYHNVFGSISNAYLL